MLPAGDRVRIDYDLDRLTECRGSTNGSEVWGVTGYASFDGGEPQAFAVSRIADGRVLRRRRAASVCGVAHPRRTRATRRRDDRRAAHRDERRVLVLDRAVRELARRYARWSVTGYWRVDGGATKTLTVTRQSADATLVAADPTITVPRGRDLEMWFSATNVQGCNAYGSNLDANYHFAIE